jgi:glycosyltransferase involved in cell wall biosynthesis
VVTALAKAVAACPGMKDDFELIFVGRVPDDQRDFIRRSAVAGIVRLTGHVPHAEAVQWIRRAHALLLMQDGAGSEIVVPAKVYEYMRAGKPILGLFRPGETTGLLEASGLGYTALPTDVEGITERILGLYRDVRGGNSPKPNREFVGRLTRKNAARELARLLDEVVAGPVRAEGDLRR